MYLFGEIKRRNVLRVGAGYVVAAWLVIQVVETIFPIYELSDASIRIVITILAIGLIPTLVFAWAFELTAEGLKQESEIDRTQSTTKRTGTSESCHLSDGLQLHSSHKKDARFRRANCSSGPEPTPCLQ